MSIMKLGMGVPLIVFIGLLLTGSLLYLFPPAIAQPADAFDPDTGDLTGDQAGAGMTFTAVTADGSEFEITSASILPGAIWIGGVAVENIYVTVRTTYSVTGFSVDADNPLVLKATVRIDDWFAEDPNNAYFALRSASTVAPYYDSDDSAKVIDAIVQVTTLEESQTDLIIGRVYLIPSAGEVSFFGSEFADIDEAIQWIWDYIRVGESTVGRTLSILFDAMVEVTGHIEGLGGGFYDSVVSPWSANYRLKVELSASAGGGGSVDVEVGAFSLEGGTGYGDIPIILMVVGAVGAVLTLMISALPSRGKIKFG